MGTYQSKYTGAEIDGLLDQVKNGGNSNGGAKVTLWEGELNASGDITFNDSADNYDFLYIKAAANTSSAKKICQTTMMIEVDSIIYTDDNGSDNTYNIGVISGNTTSKYGLIFKFPNSQTLRLISAGVTTWSNPRITKVVGIKL